MIYHFTYYYKQIGITNHLLKFFHGTSYQAEMSDWIVYPQALHKSTEVYIIYNYDFCWGLHTKKTLSKHHQVGSKFHPGKWFTVNCSCSYLASHNPEDWHASPEYQPWNETLVFRLPSKKGMFFGVFICSFVIVLYNYVLWRLRNGRLKNGWIAWIGKQQQTPLASSHIVRESSTLRRWVRILIGTAINNPPKTKLKTLENPHLSGV